VREVVVAAAAAAATTTKQAAAAKAAAGAAEQKIALPHQFSAGKRQNSQEKSQKRAAFLLLCT
jgi:hypothetical protein